MQNNIFREKSMDRVSSPEQLNDYIKVSNPAVWMIISSIIILLIGICVWGIFGKLNTVIKTGGVCENGVAHCFVKEADVAKIKSNAVVTIKDKEYPVSAMSKAPIQATGDIDSYILHLGNINEGDWVYEVLFNAPVANDVYEMNITVDSVSPMSFILQ
jgi:hypothetical protein